MTVWSQRHDAAYEYMVKEMLQYAGFQDSVRDILKAGRASDRMLDDLYDIYAKWEAIDNG